MSEGADAEGCDELTTPKRFSSGSHSFFHSASWFGRSTASAADSVELTLEPLHSILADDPQANTHKLGRRDTYSCEHSNIRVPGNCPRREREVLQLWQRKAAGLTRVSTEYLCDETERREVYEPLILLETLQTKVENRLKLVWYAMVLLSIGWLVCLRIVAPHSSDYRDTGFPFSRPLVSLHMALALLLCVLSSIVFVVFTTATLRSERRMPQQWWVVMLCLLGVAFYAKDAWTALLTGFEPDAYAEDVGDDKTTRRGKISEGAGLTVYLAYFLLQFMGGYNHLIIHGKKGCVHPPRYPFSFLVLPVVIAIGYGTAWCLWQLECELDLHPTIGGGLLYVIFHGRDHGECGWYVVTLDLLQVALLVYMTIARLVWSTALLEDKMIPESNPTDKLPEPTATPSRNLRDRVRDVLVPSSSVSSMVDHSRLRYDFNKLRHLIHVNWVNATFRVLLTSQIYLLLAIWLLPQDVGGDARRTYQIFPTAVLLGYYLLLSAWIFREAFVHLPLSFDHAEDGQPSLVCYSELETGRFMTSPELWFEKAGAQLELERLVMVWTFCRVVDLGSTEEDPWFDQRISAYCRWLGRSRYFDQEVHPREPGGKDSPPRDEYPFRTFKQNETVGVVFQLRDRILCAFRGTKVNLDNVSTDCRFCLKVEQDSAWLEDSQHTPFEGELGGYGVHAGFDDALNSIWDPVIDRENPPPGLPGGLGMLNYLKDLLTRPEHAQKPLMFVGHSLGGALATLACRAMVAEAHSEESPLHRLLDRRPNSEEPNLEDSRLSLWTLGSPMVGDQVLADFIRSHVPDSWRCFTESDPVAKMPPQPLSGKHEYVHVGTPVALSTNDIVIDPPRLDGSDIGLQINVRFRIGGTVNRHRMFYYRRCIASWIEELSFHRFEDCLIPLHPPVGLKLGWVLQKHLNEVQEDSCRAGDGKCKCHEWIQSAH